MERAVSRLILCPKVIGRAPEFAALRSDLEQAKAGRGQLALLAGEAGIGKSRLVSELKELAVAQGFLVVQGACFPTDLNYPYAPLLDLLRSLVAANPKAPLAVAVETLAQDIFPLLPELVPGTTPPLPRLEPEQEKHRLAAVLASFFLHQSTQSPVLLVVEDVHWCDGTSLDFLHYLARRSVAHPLLLLVTYRQEEPRPELSSWLAQLDRERLAHQIQLSPLAPNEVETMLSAIFEGRPTSFEMRRFLHGELLNALFTLTEGNPFFLEESLGAMIAAGDIYYAQGFWNHRLLPAARIPQSVQGAVQQRTQHLGETAKQVLTMAAVAGRHFDFDLLQELTGSDEERLLVVMKELVSAQLVVEESSEKFAFRHALTRQAIYAQLLARERARVHRAVAETMERLPSTSLDLRLEDLAYHFYQAGAWQKAADYAQRAGAKALGLYSHRAAIEYFTWALAATDRLSLPPALSLYRARGQAHEMLGEFEQAQQDYTDALAAARQTNDRVAEWQSAIDLGFNWAGRDYAHAEAWFRQALTLAQSVGDPTLQARSLNRMGNWHLNVEQSQEALRYHQEALTIFQELSDTRGIAETLDLLGMTSYLGGDLIGGTAYYQQAIALFGELEDKPGLISSLATLTLRAPTYQTDSLAATASLDEAYQDADRALRIAREIGHRSGEAYALFQAGLCLGSQGEYDRAFEATRQSLQIAEEIEHRQWQAAAHCGLGGLYSGLLAYSRAREHFEQALTLAREIGSLVWTRLATGYFASVNLLLHDLAGAEGLLHAALTPDLPAETMAQRLVWCAAVELALAQEDPARALEIIDRLAVSAVPVAEGQSSLRVLKLRGEALRMARRPDEAAVAFEAAQKIARTTGARPMQWRIWVALGNLDQDRGRNTEAEQAFATARALIEELVATIADEPLRDNFRQRAIALLPSSRPLSAKQATKQAYDGLTAREREIAALIAQGKFNREIADVLVLSERTIETHISNIMHKLNLTSRRQIASWAIGRGLTANA